MPDAKDVEQEKAAKPKPRGPKDWYKSYPPAVLQALDRLILSGDGPDACVRYLVFNHPRLLPPGRVTMWKYVKVRKEILMVDTDLRLKIEYSMRDLDMLQVNAKDPSAMVAALFDLFCQRIEIVKKLAARTGDAKYEKALIELGNSTASLMELQMKLEAHGKMMEGRMQIMVDVLAKHLVSGVQKVYQAVNGDKKLKDFSEALDGMVKGVNWESVETEMTEALAITKKGGTNA